MAVEDYRGSCSAMLESATIVQMVELRRVEGNLSVFANRSSPNKAGAQKQEMKTKE